MRINILKSSMTKIWRGISDTSYEYWNSSTARTSWSTTSIKSWTIASVDRKALAKPIWTETESSMRTSTLKSNWLQRINMLVSNVTKAKSGKSPNKLRCSKRLPSLTISTWQSKKLKNKSHRFKIVSKASLSNSIWIMRFSPRILTSSWSWSSRTTPSFQTTKPKWTSSSASSSSIKNYKSKAAKWPCHQRNQVWKSIANRKNNSSRRNNCSKSRR